ncbi:MAG: DNA cytosine methyltransferase [Rhodocyclaceae bacterium]|nr:MAG: DNA cytosine methyltransferase [Rhodocyclaceae bacterium]
MVDMTERTCGHCGGRFAPHPRARVPTLYCSPDGGGVIPIRVDYAGPGGACEGIRSLGLDSYGIEWDAAACATRAAAGHRTIRADLSTYRPGGRPEGYWGSPPCQTFSTAGKGDGRAELDRLAETIHAERWEDAGLFDSRTRHVIDAARVAVTCGAEWVAMEQVPGVLPLWSALAHVLERHGFSTWTGVLCAADYGVPQTRRRAILMASRVRAAVPPTPTHAETPGMFGEAPWVSMAEALGWDGLLDRQQPTVTGIAGAKGQWLVKRERSGDRSEETFDASGPAQALTSKARSWEVRPPWPFHQPATTVAGDPRITARCHHEAGSQGGNAIDVADVAAGVDPGDRPIRLTVRDALILQGFPPDYPVQGSRSKQFEQVGNAVPPPMAAAIVGALVGAEAMEAAS